MSVNFRISVKRFSTKVLNSLLLAFIQPRDTFESVQKYLRSIFTFSLSAELVALQSHDNNKFPKSSKRGMVSFFIGATRDFDVNNFTEILPDSQIDLT